MVSGQHFMFLLTQLSRSDFDFCLSNALVVVRLSQVSPFFFFFPLYCVVVAACLLHVSQKCVYLLHDHFLLPVHVVAQQRDAQVTRGIDVAIAPAIFFNVSHHHGGAPLCLGRDYRYFLDKTRFGNVDLVAVATSIRRCYTRQQRLIPYTTVVAQCVVVLVPECVLQRALTHGVRQTV